jgi:hypothetical protein
MEILFGFLGVVSLAAAILFGMFAVNGLQRAGRLGRPMAKVGKLKTGVRKVRGQIAPVGETLMSPLSNQPCVYYRLLLEEERKKYRDNEGFQPRLGGMLAMWLGGFVGWYLYWMSRTPALGSRAGAVTWKWHTVLERAKSAPMVIKDDSGSVLLDLNEADVLVKDRATTMSDYSTPFPTKFQELLRKRYKIDTVDDDGRVRVLRATEETLKEGAKVTVIGQVDVGDNDELCFFGNDKDGRLLISDRDVTKDSRSARMMGTAFAAAAGTVGIMAVIFFITAIVMFASSD